MIMEGTYQNVIKVTLILHVQVTFTKLLEVVKGSLIVMFVQLLKMHCSLLKDLNFLDKTSILLAYYVKKNNVQNVMENNLVKSRFKQQKMFYILKLKTSRNLYLLIERIHIVLKSISWLT